MSIPEHTYQLAYTLQHSLKPIYLILPLLYRPLLFPSEIVPIHLEVVVLNPCHVASVFKVVLVAWTVEQNHQKFLLLAIKLLPSLLVFRQLDDRRAVLDVFVPNTGDCRYVLWLSVPISSFVYIDCELVGCYK